ncbi:hypothetical protein ANN_24612 [Periplaneta americana]|uniref:Uncharacterized protein n=1 Tax=Periplaneta americana TaxID=6978 RepID=A0ABQ8S3R4_PERAM|nr:hypothetical protein ANN_24612 [Periplaneta americana]
MMNNKMFYEENVQTSVSPVGSTIARPSPLVVAARLLERLVYELPGIKWCALCIPYGSSRYRFLCAPPPNSPPAYNYIIPLPFRACLTSVSRAIMSPVETPKCIALPLTTNDHITRGPSSLAASCRFYIEPRKETEMIMKEYEVNPRSNAESYSAILLQLVEEKPRKKTSTRCPQTSQQYDLCQVVPSKIKTVVIQDAAK